MDTKKFLCKYFGDIKPYDKETGRILSNDEYWDLYKPDSLDRIQDIKVVSVWSFINRGLVHLFAWGIAAGFTGTIIYLMRLPVLHILNGSPELVDVFGALTMVGYFTWFIVILVLVTIILYYLYKYLDKKEICRCIDKE